MKEILADKIDDGFAFPLNPKWILCDEGWKDLYDKLLASEAPNVQDAVNVWYPADVQERIAAISSKHPIRFGSSVGAKRRTAEGLALMKQKRRPVSKSQIDNDEFMTEVAELELERYKHAQTGKTKLRRALLKTKKKKSRKFSFFSSALLMLRLGKEADARTNHTEVAAEEDMGRRKSGVRNLLRRLTRRGTDDSEHGLASKIASYPNERSASSAADQTESGSKMLRSRLMRRGTVDSENSSTLSISIASFQADGKGDHDEKMGRGLASNYIRSRLSSEKREDE